MSADRPINADVTPPEDARSRDRAEKGRGAAEIGGAGEETVEAAGAGPETQHGPEKNADCGRRVPSRRRRSPVGAAAGCPGPIKLVAALVVVAIGFIVLAIVAGSGSKKATRAPPPTASKPVVIPAARPSSESETEGSSEGEGEGEAESEGSAGGSAEELGYPSFATSNTTRIGGPDPVANAAATALAVFPATSEKQRPVAVSLVGKEDWGGAIAAAVLMAEPARAPLLYGEAEGVPTATASAFDALKPGRRRGRRRRRGLRDRQRPGPRRSRRRQDQGRRPGRPRRPGSPACATASRAPRRTRSSSPPAANRPSPRPPPPTPPAPAIRTLFTEAETPCHSRRSPHCAATKACRSTPSAPARRSPARC